MRHRHRRPLEPWWLNDLVVAGWLALCAIVVLATGRMLGA